MKRIRTIKRGYFRVSNKIKLLCLTLLSHTLSVCQGHNTNFARKKHNPFFLSSLTPNARKNPGNPSKASKPDQCNATKLNNKKPNQADQTRPDQPNPQP